MLNALISAARRNRVFANLFAVFIIMVGVFAVRSITVKVLPEIDLESISISVLYPGASPEEVEDAILEPIEQQLEGLEGIRKITSVATQNVAGIIVALNAGEDQNLRLNDIQNEIDQITVFPQQSERPVVAIAEPDELAIQFLISGDASYVELKKIADELRQNIIDRDGVSDVRIEAIPEYLIDIAVSERNMRAYQLSLPQLSNVIRSQSLDLSGGEIEGDSKRVLIRTLGENKVGEAFEEVVVFTGENGAVVRLKDIAEISDALADEPTAGYYDGKPAVLLSVYRVGSEQIFNLVRQSIAALKSYKQSVPSNVKIIEWRDESDNLDGRVNLLTKNAAIGILLVSVLLLLFIDLRVAFWVATGVAVAFIGSFVPLLFSGYTLNQLSLFGFILAIGIVVDDAIVVGENIYSKVEEGEEPEEAAKKGVTEVALEVLISTLTTIAVFLPLLFIPGIYGQFMGPIAAVVIFVLILSLVEAFFILPRHLSHLSDSEPRRFSPRRIADPARKWLSAKMDWFIENPLRKAVDFSVSHYVLTIVAFIAAFVLSLGLIFSGAVKFVFFPEIEGNYVTASLELTNQSSDAQTLDELIKIEKAARSAAENFSPSKKSGLETVIDGIFSTRGVSASGGDPEAEAASSAASNIGYVTVKIEDSSTRQFSAIEFERAWREKTGEIPGAKKLTFSSNLVSAGSPVQLEVKSRDEDTAREVVGKLRESLLQIDGVIDIQDDRFNTTEEIQLNLKDDAENYGVSLEDLATQVRAAFFGSVALRVQRDREEIDVRVRFTEQERQSVESIMNQRIFVNGSYIPISAVATIDVGDSPASISRKDGKRVVTLSADVDTRVTTGGSVTAQMLDTHWKKISDDYPQVEVTVGGDQEEQSRAGPAIARNFIISLFVVYALLALIFKSYAQPAVIMSIIPFGFMGALLGHFMTGYDLTLLSMFGVIGLSGVVINDSLLLVKFINQRLADGADIHDSVMEATLKRFRPIILTSLTTFLGVTPIIFETSVQAAFLAPTAVSLGIGILFATIVLIFLLPAVARLQLGLRERFFGKAKA